MHGRVTPHRASAASTVIDMGGRTGVVQVDGARLRAARLAAGYRTQQQLAAAAGFAGSGPIGAYEQGRRHPDVAALARLAQILQVPVADLLRPGTPVTVEVLRIRAGLTQAQAAARVDKSREWWSARETGRHPLDADDTARVADALGVDTAAVRAAASAEEAPVMVEVPADVASRVERQRRAGESWGQALRRILPPRAG